MIHHTIVLQQVKHIGLLNLREYSRMSFEKNVISKAEECGLKDVYFYEGTLFFDRKSSSEDSMCDFFGLYPNTIVSFLNNEVAVDFVE